MPFFFFLFHFIGLLLHFMPVFPHLQRKKQEMIDKSSLRGENRNTENSKHRRERDFLGFRQGKAFHENRVVLDLL